jgi:hypothetical protein
MTTEDLAAEVLRMLEAQRVYFKSRTQSDLIASKKLEAALIAKCRAILNPQEALFENK